MVKSVTSKEEFDAILKESGSKLIIIDFYATWCGPCKMISPKIETMSQEFKDCVFLKIDVDEQACEEIVDEYSVKVMPTFVLIKNGKVQEQLEGNVPDQLQAAIVKHCQ